MTTTTNPKPKPSIPQAQLGRHLQYSVDPLTLTRLQYLQQRAAQEFDAPCSQSVLVRAAVAFFTAHVDALRAKLAEMDPESQEAKDIVRTEKRRIGASTKGEVSEWRKLPPLGPESLNDMLKQARNANSFLNQPYKPSAEERMQDYLYAEEQE
jgi:hypothetical protein